MDPRAEALPSFHAHIQMARELGLNPKKFGSLAIGVLSPDNHQVVFKERAHQRPSGHQPHQLEALRLFRGPFDPHSGLLDQSPRGPLSIHRPTPSIPEKDKHRGEWRPHRDFLRLRERVLQGKGRDLSGDAFLAGTHPTYPPKGCRFIRRFDLYASRTKGKWPDKSHVLRLALLGCKKDRLQALSLFNPTMKNRPALFLTKKTARLGPS